MIKFEEHEWKLFRMLDKPVPLTPDAEMPCLTRLIQDDSHMGMFNRDTKPSRLSDFYLVARIANNNIIVDEFMESDYHRFEIIGYPVADGSKDWALYQMMNGKKVCNKKSPSIMYCEHADYIRRDVRHNCVDHMSVSVWINGADKNGWQIYHEPKPEQPKPKYQVGDWVEVKETATGEIEHHTVERINTFCPVSPEYLVDDVWFNHDGMEIIPLEFMFNHKRITRKLSPSEVVIPVNISGTVRQAYNEDGTIDDEQFQLLPNGSWDGTEMFISFDALDTQTRELVEGLLEEQDEEKLKGENND